MCGESLHEGYEKGKRLVRSCCIKAVKVKPDWLWRIQELQSHEISMKESFIQEVETAQGAWCHLSFVGERFPYPDVKSLY